MGRLLRALGAGRRSADQRRLRAEALALEQQRLKLALEAGAIGVFETDLPDGEPVGNEKWREIMGFAPDARVTARSVDALVIEEDRARRHAAHLAAGDPASGGQFDCRYRIRRASDGATRWIDSRGQMYFRDGAPIHVRGVNRDITDEMEAAAALEERARFAERDRLRADQFAQKRQRLAMALEAGAIGTFEVDLVEDDIRFSERHCRIFGWTAGRPMRTADLDALVVEQDLAALRDARARALSGDGRFRMRMRILRADDGALRHIDMRGQVDFDHGKPVHVFGATRDITDEIEAAAALEERARLAEQDRIRADQLWHEQQRLALALEAGAIGTFEADLVHNEIRLGNKLREIWGWTGDMQVKPGDLDALVIEEDHAAREIARARIAAQNGRYRARFRIRRASDGAIRCLDTHAQVYFDGATPVRVVGVTRDVTDETEAATALLEKARLAEQLSLLASALPGAMYSFVMRPDATGHLSYAAPQIESLLGFDAETLTRDTALVAARVHRDDMPGVYASIAASAAQRRLWQAEFRYDHPKEGEIWLEAQAQPAPREDGAIVWHGYLQDVTARETAARALSESEAKIRALKDERLAALEKMAARLAHEVNQPLAAGATMLAVARRRLERLRLRGADADELDSAAEALEKAAEQVVRAGRIMSRVREFSRHGEPDKTYRSLHGAIRETLALLEADSNFAGFEIAMRLEAARDRVLIDRMQIAAVLTNLLQNARQAARPGGPRRIAIESREQDKNIAVSVIDFGTGLSEDTRSHLFELFWTTKSSGMGVGLATSRAIIEAHHGTISAQDSSEGKTVFTFSLPLIEDDEASGCSS